MRFLSKHVELAVEEALKSDHKIKIGAVIFNGRKVISVGHNDAHRAAKKLHPRFQNFPGSVHAEVAAILKAKTDLRRMKMLVVRCSPFKKNLLLAKPCRLCESYIRYVGIKRIYYSINNYPYIEECTYD